MELKIDLSAIKKLRNKIKNFNQKQKIELCEKIAKETALLLLRRVREKTPSRTGNLRRNWYNNGKKIKNGYQENVFNQTEYASYVEYGHRKPKNNGWVNGKYMLTKSEKEISDIYQKIAEKQVNKALERLFNDQQNN